MDKIRQNLLETVADIHGTPEGAYNIRANGETVERKTVEGIEIVTKTDEPGISVFIAGGVKNQSLHIPVIVTETGLSDLVYNDFYIGCDAEVVIVAGCGIHNDGEKAAGHDGVHNFYLGRGAKVKYIEKHYGEGEGEGKKIMNPKTFIYQMEDSKFEMETVQIRGVSHTERKTSAVLKAGASIDVREKIMTDGEQYAETVFEVALCGEDSSANVVSRSVAKDESEQEFESTVIGLAPCTGHTECDAIIMDRAKVIAEPKLIAENTDAQLIHEAAIGKIAGEQLTKLMTLGMTKEEAEETIVSGFLK